MYSMPVSKRRLLNHDDPGRKRVSKTCRTKLACNRCKMKKSRCDGGQRCRSCATYDAECVYSPRYRSKMRTYKFCDPKDAIEEAIQQLYAACNHANISLDQSDVQQGRISTERILRRIGYDGSPSTTRPLTHSQPSSPAPLQTSRTPDSHHYADDQAHSCAVRYSIPPHTPAFGELVQIISPSNEAVCPDYTWSGSPTHPQHRINAAQHSVADPGYQPAPPPQQQQPPMQKHARHIQSPLIREWLDKLGFYHTMPIHVGNDVFHSLQHYGHASLVDGEAYHEPTHHSHYPITASQPVAYHSQVDGATYTSFDRTCQDYHTTNRAIEDLTPRPSMHSSHHVYTTTRPEARIWDAEPAMR